ncbi:UDP-N-acetylmuramoyl-L-alanine--D-glutamate ligase [Hoyosella altamirensis]|uniref:UDP-N-acetylmuramoyl-L-alanine--D-glutamate ligase n=1 Tax=Hoyosella altamirensis TaxID=616997 RepID=UPI0007DB6944|nr:UDP-N-acetylmuramoyl-L-alanine--D-glutamate ligase [Hoyosella altamirensis]
MTAGAAPAPRPHDFAGSEVLVAGAGVSGLATVRALNAIGARAVVADTREHALEPAIKQGARGILLEPALQPGRDVFDGIRLVVTSPGWRPDAALLAEAARNGIPVWGDVELAWRLDQAGIFGPPRRWLAVTGTNGKTTTTTMLNSILRAAGLKSAACGNIGRPILDAMMAGCDTDRSDPSARIDVLAIELSSFQLFWAPSVTPEAGVILNIAEDHLDWHGSMDAYVAAKLQVLTGRIGVLGLDDPVASQLASRSMAARTIGFRLSVPGPNEFGVADGYLVDRAFGDAAGVRLVKADEVRPGGRPGLLDGLAAAALARGIGVSPEAVAEGLRTHETGPHRNAKVASLGGVTYVDDSKATNPHAALASISTYPRVVWLAGGLLKGANVEELVADVRDQLVAAVLIGADRGVIAQTLARHAPDVPVVEVFAGDDRSVTVTTIQSGRAGTPSTAQEKRYAAAADIDLADAVMARAVNAAAALAQPGDTVLLAPSAASLDMFRDYGHRGRSFAHAVAALGSPPLPGVKGVAD